MKRNKQTKLEEMEHVHITKKKFHFSEGAHKMSIPPSGPYLALDTPSQLQHVSIKNQFVRRYKNKLSAVFSAIWQCSGVL